MTTLNLEEIGYPAVREAFKAALAFCSENLTKAEVNRAYEALNIEDLDEDLDEDQPGHLEMVGESALFSVPHTRRKRAVDRLAAKLAIAIDTGAIEADSFTAMVQALLAGSRKAGRRDTPS